MSITQHLIRCSKKGRGVKERGRWEERGVKERGEVGGEGSEGERGGGRRGE